MKITTAINHRDRLLGHVREAFHLARLCASPNAQIREMISKRIYTDSAWPSLPGWVSQRVSNMILDEYQRIYAPVLGAAQLERLLAAPRGDASRLVPYVRWQLRLDGAHVNSDQICAISREHDPDVWQRVEGAHIWNHKPNHKPYGDGGWQLVNPPKTTTTEAKAS